MTRLLAPVLSFTADEIWLAMAHDKGADGRNVCLNDMPQADPAWTLTEEEENRWAALLRIRADVNKALELSRAEKRIGKPLDAKVTLFARDEAEKLLKGMDAEALPALFIVSEAEIVFGQGDGVPGENVPGLTVKVEPSTLPKCERCWTHSASVGSDSDHPTLCARCAAAVR